jgi:hypothetical protein
MTTLITRLYASEKAADAMADKLYWKGFPKRSLQVVTGSDKAAVEDRLKRAHVPAETAAIYAEHVAGGTALLMIAATYKPLGAAKIARTMTAKSDAMDVAGVVDETKVPDLPDHAPSVLKDHPRFLSMGISGTRNLVSDQLGLRTLSKHRERNSAISGGRFMSRAFWPMKLVSTNRTASSAISGGKHMSRAFWPMPLLSSAERRNSVMPGGGTPFSRALGFKTLSSSRS